VVRLNVFTDVIGHCLGCEIQAGMGEEEQRPAVEEKFGFTSAMTELFDLKWLGQ
jgi:hypothetical protein